MDNKQSLEDKPTTNAAAEEILSDEELDSVAGGGGTGRGSGSASVAVGNSICGIIRHGTGTAAQVAANSFFKGAIQS